MSIFHRIISGIQDSSHIITMVVHSLIHSILLQENLFILRRMLLLQTQLFLHLEVHIM